MLFSFLSQCKTFCSQVSRRGWPKGFHRVNVITFGGPTFHHPNLMLLQPTRGGFCRVTRRLVLLEFPPSLFVFKSPFRGRQQRVLQNVLICGCVQSALIEGQLSLALRAESSPRIHRQPPPLHLVSRDFTHRFGQTKLCRGLPPLNCLNVCSSPNTTLLQSFLMLL